jgi:DENN (AEX-3) domain
MYAPVQYEHSMRTLRTIHTAMPTTLLCVDQRLHIQYCCTAQQVIVVSKRPGLLSATVLALASLLRPLLWVGLHVPLLPAAMWDVIDAPLPYLIGLPLCTDSSSSSSSSSSKSSSSSSSRVRAAPMSKEELTDGQVGDSPHVQLLADCCNHTFYLLCYWITLIFSVLEVCAALKPP